MKRTDLAVAAAVLVMAGCQGGAMPGPEGGTPAPSRLERTMLGGDADDPYFLARFRSCAAFASYTYCQAEMYGGLPR